MENIQNKAKEFIEDYKVLVEKHKLQLAAAPKFMQRDDGTFSVVVELGIVPVPEKK